MIISGSPSSTRSATCCSTSRRTTRRCLIRRSTRKNRAGRDRGGPLRAGYPDPPCGLGRSPSSELCPRDPVGSGTLADSPRSDRRPLAPRGKRLSETPHAPWLRRDTRGFWFHRGGLAKMKRPNTVCLARRLKTSVAHGRNKLRKPSSQGNLWLTSNRRSPRFNSPPRKSPNLRYPEWLP